MATPAFLRKLGGRPGDVLLVPEPDLRPFAAGSAVVPKALREGKVRGVVFRPRRRDEIPRDLRRYRDLIEEDGFIWAVIPKKAAIEALGRDVTFEDVIEFALRTDLVDKQDAHVLGAGVRRPARRPQAPPPLADREASP